MPNWCVGTLKVRGKKENLKRFLGEAIIVPDCGLITHQEKKMTPDELGDFHQAGSCWIKGTRRGFVDGVDVYLSDYEDNETIVIMLESRFAWCIEAIELLAIAKEYGVDIKIYAFECGIEFNQDIEIVNGEIVKNEEINFADYQWECIMPQLGG